MITAFIFILGLLVGSFLNVVIIRLHQKKPFIFGRSACPTCGQPIFWYDNIPLLSFLILKGRCRFCHKSISWQYPLVELVTALIFFWLYYKFGLSFEFFVLTVFSCFLIIIFVYDLKHYLILDQVVWPAMIFALFANWYYLNFNFWYLIFASLVGSGFFALQFYLSKGKWVGDGDIQLGALMGLMLGWPGLLTALFLAYFSGALVGLVLIFFRRKEMSSPMPFGPFLTGATFITLLYGQQILAWYLNLIYY